MTGGYTMKEKNIRELAKRMGLITVEDMCQYPIAQLVVKIANKVNELVDEVWRFETDVQEMMKTQTENIQYLLGEGLHLEVGNIFDVWVQDGTFDTLLNQSALKKVNNRIDETNAQLSEINLVVDSKKNNILKVGKTREYTDINSAINYAKENGVSSSNRYTIKLDNGTYTEKLVLTDGIDIEGTIPTKTIIQYSGTGFRKDDTIFCSCDCSIKNLTVVQYNQTDGETQNYPIHIDGNENPFNVVIENVKVYSYGNKAHHAIGIGLYGNQTLTLKNSYFFSEFRDAFYLHNQVHQSKRFVFEAEGCKFFTNGAKSSGVLVEDVGSGVYDEMKFIGCQIHGGGVSIKLQKHASFSGNRKYIFIRLKSCVYNSYDYEDDGGRIIDEDKGFFDMKCPPLDGDILEVSGYEDSQVLTQPSVTANSSNVIGVAVNFMDYISFCQTKGIVTLIVTNNVSVGDRLKVSSGGGCERCNSETDNNFAIALEKNTSGTYAKIKAYLK